jgi:hypothetical protein
MMGIHMLRRWKRIISQGHSESLLVKEMESLITHKEIGFIKGCLKWMEQAIGTEQTDNISDLYPGDTWIGSRAVHRLSSQRFARFP